MKATAAALVKFPQLNATLDEAAGEIVQRGHRHIGLAHRDRRRADRAGRARRGPAVDRRAGRARSSGWRGSRARARRRARSSPARRSRSPAWARWAALLATPIINHPRSRSWASTRSASGPRSAATDRHPRPDEPVDLGRPPGRRRLRRRALRRRDQGGAGVAGPPSIRKRPEPEGGHGGERVAEDPGGHGGRRVPGHRGVERRRLRARDRAAGDPGGGRQGGSRGRAGAGARGAARRATGAMLRLRALDERVRARRGRRRGGRRRQGRAATRPASSARSPRWRPDDVVVPGPARGGRGAVARATPSRRWRPAVPVPRALGVLPGSPYRATQLPHATGIAWAMKLEAKGGGSGQGGAGVPRSGGDQRRGLSRRR